MHVSLTPELEAMVKSMVKSGDYNNASEVVRHALRNMRKENEAYQIKLDNFYKALDVGIDDVENGRFSDKNVEDIISGFTEEQR